MKKTIETNKVTLGLDYCVGLSDLARLFGRSPGAIEFWTQQKGLIRQPDGTYNLRSSIIWLEKYCRNSAKQKVKVDGLNQQQLAGLFGVSRQTLSAWGQSGLKKTNGGYNLKDVCRWMRCYYQDLAAKKYQKRLATMRKKVGRNAAQLERFLRGA